MNVMTTHYRLTHRGSRGGMFYCVDKTTGKRTSLQTTNKEDAQQIVDAKNQSERQPGINLQIAQAYLTASDPASRVSVPFTVQRDPRPYWEVHGWKEERGKYQGNFQTKFGSWAGYVTVSPGGRVEVFIHNPPAVLKQHPHWQCFQARERGWFFIHPSSRLVDVSAGIIGVEKTITEAYEK